MPSSIIQSPLNNSIGTKPSSSTYADHFQWKQQRRTRKDHIVSTYSQQYQQNLRHTQLNRSNSFLPADTHEAQKLQRTVSMINNVRDSTLLASYRPLPSKPQPVQSNKSSIAIAQHQQRVRRSIKC
jgi:hypothetical protein